jgi:hypothetical protein
VPSNAAWTRASHYQLDDRASRKGGPVPRGTGRQLSVPGSSPVGCVSRLQSPLVSYVAILHTIGNLPCTKGSTR